jgi:hypothetical protein
MSPETDRTTAPGSQAPAPDPAVSRRTLRTIGVAAVVVLGVLLLAGLLPRLAREKCQQEAAASPAAPRVSVAAVKRGPPEVELALPASIQAMVEAPIYARAEGYVRRRLVDIGDTVTRDQLLAEISSPELDQQVLEAEASLRRSRSAQRLLLALMDRLERLLLDPIRAIAAEADATPTDRLSRILTHHLRIVLEHDSLPILLLAEASASGDPTLVARMQAIFNPYWALLRELLAHVCLTGRTRASKTAHAARATGRPPAIGPESLALLLLGVSAALAIQHRLQPDRRIDAQAVDEVAPWLITAISGISAPDPSRRTRR